jgi:NAD(P)-dependent dehydrogenase (short-subunit alcohol dehydrogenase family)
MSIDLKGRRVLVVGASSGIGKATAAAFVAAGATVFAASRGGEKLLAAAAEIGAEPVVLDTHDNAAIEAFFAGQPAFDHVVISAAQTKGGPVGKLPLEDAYAAMESKFWGAYRVARAARIAEDGSLTFVSGQLAHRPSAASVLQGAINAAVEALGRGLALEKAPVRVNTVSPGLIATPLHNRLSDSDRQALYERTAERVPARRVGEAEDVAAAVLTELIGLSEAGKGEARAWREPAPRPPTCKVRKPRRTEFRRAMLSRFGPYDSVGFWSLSDAVALPERKSRQGKTNKEENLVESRIPTHTWQVVLGVLQRPTPCTDRFGENPRCDRNAIYALIRRLKE